MGSMEIVERARKALESIQTIDEAKSASDALERLELVAKQEGYGLQTQNMVALKRIQVQREGGKLLAELAEQNANRTHQRDERGKIRPERYLPDGMKKTEAYAWRKLAGIDEDSIQAYAEAAMTKGREITRGGVLKLASKDGGKPARTQWTPPKYAAKSIDSEIAETFGHDLGRAVAAIMLEQINTTLHWFPNSRYTFVWSRYHGFNDQGEAGPQWSFEGIGMMMGGLTREYVQDLYFRADSQIWRHVSLRLSTELKKLILKA